MTGTWVLSAQRCELLAQLLRKAADSSRGAKP